MQPSCLLPVLCVQRYDAFRIVSGRAGSLLSMNNISAEMIPWFVELLAELDITKVV